MNEINLLNDHAAGYGIELNRLSLESLSVYLDELTEWNQKINLTGLTTRHKIVNELFLDSLIPAPFLPRKGRLLDVGSGAGFPGMVLKISNPGLHVHLLEPNSKRTSFLKHVIRLLKLENIDVLRGRIEKDEKILHRDGYDIITSRALSGLPQIIDWCTPHLLENGVLVGFLGTDADNILRVCRPDLKEHGLVLSNRISYMLPGKDSERITVLLKKRRPRMR